MKLEGGKILTLDAECLPGHWIGGDYVSKIMTAAAWKWDDRPNVEVRTHYQLPAEEIAEELAAAIEQADLVVGHWVRGFDLRLINGQLLRGGYRHLDPVLALDTKSDLYSTHGRSLSQKNLSAEVGVSAPKIDVTLYEWEAFNTRVPGFEQKGQERVVGDVLQNVELRAKLLDLGWLKAPKRWTGNPSSGRMYHG